MSKSIRDLLPKVSNAETVAVQAQVDAELVAEVREIMDENGWRWNDVITACLIQLREDMRK